MKLIIDIPEKDMRYLNCFKKDCSYADNVSKGVINKVIEVVRNSTPIPDNATNGDMFRVFFPNGIEMQDLKNTTERWWNAPYQKGGKE